MELVILLDENPLLEKLLDVIFESGRGSFPVVGLHF